MSDLLTNRLREFAQKVDGKLDTISDRIDVLEGNPSGTPAPKLHVGTTPPADLTSVWIDTN